jgi:hypothetical protein
MSNARPHIERVLPLSGIMHRDVEWTRIMRMFQLRFVPQTGDSDRKYGTIDNFLQAGVPHYVRNGISSCTKFIGNDNDWLIASNTSG